MSTLPVQGQDYEFTIGLTDAVNAKRFVVDPTIASGDFQISKDDGALANLTNLPMVTPAGTTLVAIDLTAAEMDASKVVVIGIDQTVSPEWVDTMYSIDVPVGSSETAVNILEGDHDESNVEAIIYLKDTTDILVRKEITGSLLSSGIVITTREPS